MKKMRKWMALFLAALSCAGLLALPAAATAVEHDGLEISIVMDQETYEVGEAITATITVTNVSADTITIANLEQLIPAGYKLAEDSEVAMKDVEMHPGRILVLQVTFEGDASQAGSSEEEVSGPAAFLNTILYGRTLGVPNMFLTVMLVLAIGLFLFLT